MLAAPPIRAQEPVSAGPVSAGKVSVVRVDRKTGRLVRTVAASKPSEVEVLKMVDEAARKHQVDPLLVRSVVKVESAFNSEAVSPKGAEGLMQLMPPTAKMLGVSDSFDAKQNIEAGVKYLRQLQDTYKDDRLALAAYNAGPGAVDRYHQVPPYKETQRYVQQVGDRYLQAKRTQPPPPPTPSVAPPAQASPEKRAPEKRLVLESFTDPDGKLHLTATER